MVTIYRYNQNFSCFTFSLTITLQSSLTVNYSDVKKQNIEKDWSKSPLTLNFFSPFPFPHFPSILLFPSFSCSSVELLIFPYVGVVKGISVLFLTLKNGSFAITYDMTIIQEYQHPLGRGSPIFLFFFLLK